MKYTKAKFILIVNLWLSSTFLKKERAVLVCRASFSCICFLYKHRGKEILSCEKNSTYKKLHSVNILFHIVVCSLSELKPLLLIFSFRFDCFVPLFKSFLLGGFYSALDGNVQNIVKVERSFYFLVNVFMPKESFAER